MSGEDQGEKQHDASERKLAEARKRGELVRSADVAVAAAYAGLLIAAVAFGSASLTRFATYLMVLLDQADTLSPLLLSNERGAMAGFFGQVSLSLAVWFLVPMLCVILALVAQRAVVFAPEKLQPKIQRIDPIANAKQKFGRNGLFEFAKSTVKLIVIGTVLGWFLASRMPRILVTLHLSPGQAVAVLGRLIVEFIFVIFVIAAVIGAADYFWQRFEHLRRNRMTRQEVVEEYKQSEGDPHIKSQRRQRAVDIATNRMLADVPKADVVIVNPTHYAVALRWNRGGGQAPVCVAKGVDAVAARIRELAAEHAVPVHSDPPTARALHAAVDIGQEIQPEHYRQVAAAIRFAERMRKRARERQGWR